MIEGFLLDGIDMSRGNQPVAGSLQFAALHHADPAQSELPFCEPAPMRTQPAFDPVVITLAPILRTLQVGLILARVHKLAPTPYLTYSTR
jgi:hypothetical protein